MLAPLRHPVLGLLVLSGGAGVRRAVPFRVFFRVLFRVAFRVLFRVVPGPVTVARRGPAGVRADLVDKGSDGSRGTLRLLPWEAPSGRTGPVPPGPGAPARGPGGPPPPGAPARPAGRLRVTGYRPVSARFARLRAANDAPLLAAVDANARPVAEAGSRRGSVSGTFMHVIDRAA